MCMCYEGECKHKSGYRKSDKNTKQVVDKVIEVKKKEDLSDFRLNVGKRMVSARKMAGLSLEEAAKLFSITKQALNRYELGKIEIDSEVLVRFSKAYNHPVEFFLRRPMIIEFGEIKVHKLKRY